MKTLKIDELRFQALLEKAMWHYDGIGSVIEIGRLYEIINSLRCSNRSCDNECRYDSGYCSLCDMKFNDNQGKRITHPEPE